MHPLLPDLCVSVFFLFATRHHLARGPKDQFLSHFTQVAQSFFTASRSCLVTGRVPKFRRNADNPQKSRLACSANPQKRRLACSADGRSRKGPSARSHGDPHPTFGSHTIFSLLGQKYLRRCMRLLVSGHDVSPIVMGQNRSVATS